LRGEGNVLGPFCDDKRICVVEQERGKAERNIIEPKRLGRQHRLDVLSDPGGGLAHSIASKKANRSSSSGTGAIAISSRPNPFNTVSRK
jgi:hypothetical protein